ncbi:MAG: aryl-sulfate sulfotransferase [Myxococcota bacterium]
MLLLLACTPPAPPLVVVEALTVALTDMPTVIRVRWHTVEPTHATVTGRFGDEEAPIVVTETADANDHEVLLAGLPGRTDVSVEVRVDDETAEATIATGSLPSWVPDVTYTADAPEAAQGGFVVAPMIDLSGGGILVFDHAGRPVWAHARADDKEAAMTRARLSLDGRAVLYLATAGAEDDDGLVIRMPIDGGAATETPLRGTHTDFVELPSGGYAALGWQLHTMEDGRVIVGDTIVEIDADGVSHIVWSVFDDFVPDPRSVMENQYPGDPTIPDWSHVNGITYDAVSDDYYVTMTWNSGVARIDRGTGALVWMLSDEGGDFADTGDTRMVWLPHSVQPTDTGLLLFNRGDPRDPTSCSEATDLVLDEALGTASRSGGLSSERCLLITFLGSAQRLPGGNTLIGWSTAGQIDEYTPDGQLAGRFSTNIGAGFGFAGWVPTLGSGVP